MSSASPAAAPSPLDALRTHSHISAHSSSSSSSSSSSESEAASTTAPSFSTAHSRGARSRRPTIVILGTGLIGGFLAASLTSTPSKPPVLHLIGRPSLQEKIEKAGGMRVTRLEEPKPEDPGFLTSFIYNPIVSYLSVSRGAAGSLDASNEDDEDGADGDEDEDEEHDDETGEVVVGPRTAFTPKSKIHVHTSLAAYKAYALGRARSAGKPRGPDYVVLTAKRTGTAAAIEEMKACGLGAAVSGSGDDAAAASPAGSAEDARFWERTAVVTFQNGARAGEEIRRAFSERVEVVEGMWPFNVVEPEPCHYFQATSGTLYVTDSPTGRAFHKLLIAGSLPAKTSKDMDGVLYGKLLFNLNNAVCALADSTIRSTLVVRGYRKAYAMCVTEALAVYTAAGIHPVSFVPVPLWVLPYILSLPTPLFSRVAASFLAIDPAAVSSTTVDLRDGKPTEIAYLQGEICRLAREHYVAAPMCDRIVGLVREAESLGKGNWERIGPEELLDALEML